MVTEPAGSEFHEDQSAWEALARRVAGEPPAGELDEGALRAWLEADPGREALAHLLEHAPTAPEAEGIDVEAALAAVRSRIAGRPELRAQRGDGERRAPRPARWWTGALPIAAAVVLILAAALLYRRFVAAPAGVEAARYATAVGERRPVRLPDGSSVLLGPGSRLTVAAGYGAPQRAVELRGEALFDVVHDADRPFSVRAGGAVIRDLGTRFTVETAAGAGVRVAVESGRVRLGAVGRADTGIVVEKGELGMLPAGGTPRAWRDATIDEDLAWTEGRLVFRDASFDRVAARLRRWYGLQIRAADTVVAGRHLTASFEGDPAREVVNVVALSLGAEVTMHGDTAVLRSIRRVPP